MRFLWLLAAAFPVCAQTCVPARLLPAATVSGALDNSSCRLSDGSAYAAYRLDLPTRGRIRISLTTAQDFALILRDSSGASLDGGAAIDRPIEPGGYTLLVNARAAGQVGDYSVETAFTEAPGTWCAAFPLAGLSQAVSGRLGASGCSMPDGTPYEAYIVNTLGAGTLTVTVAASDFTPLLFLRTPDGGAAASGDTSVSAAVDAGAAYQIVVATADHTGAFQIATSFEPAEGETCRPVKTLADSANESGAITAESCVASLAGSSDPEYYNYYLLRVDAGGAAKIAAASADFAPALYLLDEGGNTVAGGGPEIRAQLAPGIYTLQVVSSILSGGNYTLAYQIATGPPQPCGTTPIAPGDGPSGALSAANCRTELGPAQIYGVSLPSAGTLDLTLTTDLSMTGAIAIRDLKDNLIVMVQDVQGLGITRLSADLPSGTYTVVAAAAAGSGGYQLTTKFGAHDTLPCSLVQPLDRNGGYIKFLSSFSCRAANGQPMDLFEFTLPADGAVAAIMTSSAVDGYLSLLDAAGNVLRTDDNSYGFNDPLILDYLPAGTYRLAARATSGTTGGLYEVDVRSSLGRLPVYCGSKATIRIGGSATGAIDFSGCRYPATATFADLYQIDVTESGALDLVLRSGDFDAFLVLLDAKGNVVAQDNDSAGNTDAKVSLLLAPGTYYVVATAATDYTAAGAYTLSVSPVN